MLAFLSPFPQASCYRPLTSQTCPSHLDTSLYVFVSRSKLSKCVPDLLPDLLCFGHHLLVGFGRQTVELKVLHGPMVYTDLFVVEDQRGVTPVVATTGASVLLVPADGCTVTLPVNHVDRLSLLRCVPQYTVLFQ